MRSGNSAVAEVGRPPRDGLVRLLTTSPVELRSSGVDGSLGTLEGHFAVFNEATEIDSIFEGHFIERIAPGAFRKTFSEQREQMRVLFQHGFDPVVGDKPLGPIDDIGEDDVGARYSVPLIDTSYNRDLVPGLKAGLYGASFRFRVIREDFNREPEPSDSNPEGLPERTIREAQVSEFGPVTFPAYPTATAGMRSLTDRFLTRRLIGGQLQREGYVSDDVSCIAQMVVLASDFIEAEDDPADIAAMKEIQQSLTSLLDIEASEPDDESGDEGDMADSGRSQDQSQDDAGRTPTSAAGAKRRSPLYGLGQKETPPWHLQ
jgi:HK97 family phage prohead protease